MASVPASGSCLKSCCEDHVVDFPNNATSINNRNRKLSFSARQKDGQGRRFKAVIPNRFVPIEMSIEGGLVEFRDRLLIKDRAGSVILDIESRNAGFYIHDKRSDERYILSRNGSTFFLYSISGFRQKVPVAVIHSAKLRGEAIIHSLRDGKRIGKLYRNSFSNPMRKFFGLPRTFTVKTYPGFDCVLVMALRMIYEAICKTMVPVPELS